MTFLADELGDVIERELRFVDDLAQNEARVDAGDALDSREPSKKETLVIRHVWQDRFEQVVGGLAGDDAAFDDFGEFLDLAFKVFKSIGGMAVHRNADHRRNIEAQPSLVKECGMALDDAGVVEVLNPS